MLRRGAALLLGLLLATVTAAPAMADGPIVCPPGTIPDPNGGQCVITVLVPGGGGSNGGGGWWRQPSASGEADLHVHLAWFAEGHAVLERRWVVVGVAAGVLQGGVAAAAVERPGVGWPHGGADLRVHPPRYRSRSCRSGLLDLAGAAAGWCAAGPSGPGPAGDRRR